MGVLRDAVSCTVTEERNGAFELEMVYPITGQHYSSLALRGLILAKPNPYGEAQYFRIYKISRPINGQVTVNAQHISYDLSGIPVGPCKALNAVDALQQLKSHAAVSCDYQFWTDIQTVADFAVAVPGSLRSLLGGVEGSVLDETGDNFVEVDLEANREYLKRQGIDTEEMTDTQIREANTGSYLFLTGACRFLDAMEDLTLKMNM